MSKHNKMLIIIYIIAVIALAVIIYAIPSVTGALTKTELLQYGVLQVTDTADCYIIRNEQVYLSGAGGTINYYVKDGVKVRSGTTILSLTHTGSSSDEESKYASVITKLGSSAVTQSDYKSQFNGIVSYYVDGYEGYFSPEKIEALTYDEVKKIDIKDAENMTRASTYKGEPLYKICDNDLWYLTCFVKEGSVSKYEVDHNVTVQLPLGDVDATIVDVIPKNNMWQVILKTDKYYEDFAKMRMVEANIVTSDYSGIIIPNKSIATDKGTTGVYVKSKSGEYTFEPIKIKTSDGENSIVWESYFYDANGNKVTTVNTYDEILKNPAE